MSGGGGVSGAASSEGLSGEGGGGSAEWRRMYDRIEALLPRVEALAADRARLEALNRTQRDLSGAREKDLHARLVQAEASRTRWKKAYIDLPLLADPKIIELKEKDSKDSRKRKSLFDDDNSVPEIQLRGGRRHVELSETNVGDEDIVRDLMAELTKLKQASETLSTNKDKEAIEVAQKLQQNIEELQVAARKKDDAIARLRVEAVDAKNKLRAMEKDYTALVKMKEVEGAEATEATHKFQNNLEELQVAAGDKDDEIRRLAAEALAAKNNLLVPEEMARRYRLLNLDIEKKHRARILEDEPNSLEPLVTRTPKVNWRIHPAWVPRLKWAGLLPFVRLVEDTRDSTRLLYDQSLLTCLVDRWRPETHTFHFRWGEMAPTLQDVSYLLGLPLAGHPIGPLQAPKGWQQDMAQRFQDIGGPFEHEEHGPKLEWLLGCQIQSLGYPETQLTEAQITRCLEAYILWLLGKVMFTENHVTTITARYIPIALEIANATNADMIIQRSWGSAVLAATYRGMCSGCQRRAPKSGLLGCPLLLQLWSWERFPIGRPNVLVDKAYPTASLDDPQTGQFDPERVDLPTFGTVWTRRQRRFSHNQVRGCYPALSEQFDILLASSVMWEPYTDEAIATRFQRDGDNTLISILCTRDTAYWLTKSKIIFDMQAEEMSLQRVMRQFGLRQLADPRPTESVIPSVVHTLSRKGSSKTATGWLHRVGVYVEEWDTATAQVWDSDAQFDMKEFNNYLASYMNTTRLRIVQRSRPEEMSGAATWDSYPSQFTVGSRQHAAQLIADLETESVDYRRSLSSGPLLIQCHDQQTWLSRLEEKLQRIYEVITCTRSLDIGHHPAPQRPPRHSTHQQQQCPPLPLRQSLCPWFTPQTTSIPPPPDQAGGSSWQQQSSFNWWQQQQEQPPLHACGSSWQHQQHEPWGHPPMPNYGFRPQPQPQGAFRVQGSMPGYQSSMSGSEWTDEDVDQTPPDPTQETQYDEYRSVIPSREVQPPHKFGWTTPPHPPPERRGRRRR